MKQRVRFLLTLILTVLVLAVAQTCVFAAEKKSFAIGSTKYESLQDAFDHVKNGQTIKVLSNYELYGPNMNRNVRFKLDLNGKTLTLAPFATINLTKGSMTLIGKSGSIKKNGKSGTIFFVNHGSTLTIKPTKASFTGSIRNNGTLSIKSGTFSSIKTNRIPLIINSGKLTVSGGTFKDSSNNPILENQDIGVIKIDNGNFRHSGELDTDQTDVYDPARDSTPIIRNNCGSTKGKITINGGSYTSTCIIFKCDGGTLIVEDGTFTSGAGVLWNDNQSVTTLKGGSFSVKGHNLELATNSGKAKMTISGGHYTSDWSLFENWSPHSVLTVSGGTMSTTMKQKTSAMVLNMAGRTTISGGTFKGKNTNGYWYGSGSVTVKGKPKWNVLKKRYVGNLLQ